MRYLQPSLKFVQVHTFYPAYLTKFHKDSPLLSRASFNDQITALIQDGFSAAHMIAPYMGNIGYESHLIIANNLKSQVQWLNENDLLYTKTKKWVHEITKKQIDTIKPDILYLSDPITFDSEFVRSLTWKPALVVGWRAASIPQNTDWSEFDLILSSLTMLREAALRLGAKSAEHFSPGFPAWIEEKIRDVQPTHDVVFSGQWTRQQHARRNMFLKKIAQNAKNSENGFSCAYYLSGQTDTVSPDVSKFNLGSRFGIQMHRALKTGCICIDARAAHYLHDSKSSQLVDIGGQETANMRIFEATGSNVFLLTEYFDNLKQFFEPGYEIETFRTHEELIEKIRYYLTYEKERNLIADRGYQKCITEFSMPKRVQAFDAIIRKHLKQKSLSTKNALPCSIGVTNSTNQTSLSNQFSLQITKNIDVGSPVSSLTHNLKVQYNHFHEGTQKFLKGKFKEAFQILSRAKSYKAPLEGLDYHRALCLLKMEKHLDAREALKEELRYFPDSNDAKQLLEQINSQNPQEISHHNNDGEFCELLKIISPYTMIGNKRLYSLFLLAKKLCIDDIPGNFVECGVAAGGSSALLGYVIKKYSKTPRILFAFDSFEGMPEPTSEDHHAGIAANDTGWGTGTCSAPEASVKEVCTKLNISDCVKTIKGYFQHTLKAKRNDIGSIALLHVDGDWYESTNCIFNNLYELVVEKGIIQIDDYGFWAGCKKAVKEFQSLINQNFKLKKIDNTGVWFTKPSLHNSNKPEQAIPIQSIPLQQNPTNKTKNGYDPAVLLNLGCGSRFHPDWINIDFNTKNKGVISHDLTLGIPVADSTCDAIYHSHLLEHFPKSKAPYFINECFRALKPGGVLRVAVPDLEQITRLYIENLEKAVGGDAEAEERYQWLLLEMYDQAVRTHSGGEMLKYWQQDPMPAEKFVASRIGPDTFKTIRKMKTHSSNRTYTDNAEDTPASQQSGKKLSEFRRSGEMHQWMYDRFSLEKLLLNAGFSNIKVCRADESQIPSFNKYHLDTAPNGSIRKPDSLFMEASKPFGKTLQNTPLKVAHLCISDFGGAGKAAYRLHKGLQKIGIDSSMYVFKKKSADDSVTLIPQKHSPSSLSNKTTSAERWKELWRHWESIHTQYPGRPAGLEVFSDTRGWVDIEAAKGILSSDIINLHWVSGVVDYPESFNIFSKKNIVWTLHDMNAFTGGCHYTGECRQYLDSCGACPQLGSNNKDDISRMQWLLKKSAYENININVVAPSKWLADCAQESSLLSRFHTRCIPNSLPLDIFKPHNTQQVRHDFNIPQQAKIVLFGADSVQNHRKGFTYVLNALSILDTSHPHENIILMCFGDSKNIKQNRLNYPIVQIGRIQDENKLAAVYSAADVYVIPSLEDNLPNTVLESMACGTPAIGFNIGGIPDMIENGETGYIVSPENIQGLAKAIANILFVKPETAKKISAACRKKAIDNYSQEIQAHEYKKTYHQMLNSNNPSPSCRHDNTNIVTIPESEAPVGSSPQTHDPMSLLSYSRKSHVLYLRKHEKELYGEKVDTALWDLKRYQDLLIFTFIKENIPQKAKILEIGGGNSRILKHYHLDYECWNIDKFAGMGNGPTTPDNGGYQLVRDYIGNFNSELPDDYFDFVFSISALEHSGNDPVVHEKIHNDIQRVLKGGGYSLHCFDVVINKDKVWTNKLLLHLFEVESTINPFISFDHAKKDPDLYIMSRKAYQEHWEKVTGKPYEQAGKPFSYNILWQKKTCRNDAISGIKPSIVKTNDYPRISVVTPSYNQAEFLEECIDSVLSQGYPNLEYIIMDGGSTDRSIEILKKHEKHLTFWQSKSDGGQYDAINEGFKKTTGDIMTWLNSDDVYHPYSFQTVAEIFSHTPDIRWLTGRPNGITPRGKRWVRDYLPVWSRKKYLEHGYWNPFIQQEGTFWKKSLWIEAGSRLQTGLDLAGDLELWARFFRFDRLYSVNALLAAYRSHPDQKAKVALGKYIDEAEEIIARENSFLKKVGNSTLYPPPEPLLLSKNRFAFQEQKLNSIVSQTAQSNEITHIIKLLINCNASSQAYKILSRIYHLYENDHTLQSLYRNLSSQINNKTESFNISKAQKKSIAQKNDPKISIVTPSYNQAQYLEKTIKSVLDQEYSDFEYIIIDGGSTDGSIDIIKRYENHLTYWISEKDKGQSHAINKGFAKCTGQIFNWLNSDDYLEPGALQKIAEAYHHNPHAAAWVGACRTISDSKKTTIHPNGLFREHIGNNWNGKVFYQPACFLNSSIIKKIGFVDNALHYCMDLDLYIRLSGSNIFDQIDGIIANAFNHSEAKTKKHIKECYKEVIATQKKYGFSEGSQNRHERGFGSGRLQYVMPSTIRKQLQQRFQIYGDRNLNPLEQPLSFYNRKHICFFGDFNTSEMYDGAQFIIKKVAPHLLSMKPTIEFHFLGRGSSIILKSNSLPWVKTFPEPKNLSETLVQYKLIVFPFKHKCKDSMHFLNAASLGIPIVTTSLGCAGLPVSDGKECFIADAGLTFAEKCHQCLIDPPTWGNFSSQLLLFSELQKTFHSKCSTSSTLDKNNIPAAKKLSIVEIQTGFPALSATFILDQITGLIDHDFTVENWATYDPKENSAHPDVHKYSLLDKTKYINLPKHISLSDCQAWFTAFLHNNSIENIASIDAFHVHYGSTFNALKPLFQQYPDKYVLVSFHGHDASRYFQKNGGSCYEYLFKRANQITTPSYAMKDTLIAHGCPPEKISVHRYGVNLNKFAPHSQEKKTKSLTLLTVARLVEKKGIEHALHALSKIQTTKHLRYRILGAGPLEQELQHLTKKLSLNNTVEFLGPANKERVIKEMSQADIFILTSITALDGDQEGIPVSLIEAHAMGLPVISSYHAGIPELVIHNTTGLLSPEKDVDSIKINLETLINNEKTRASFAHKARQHVEREFNINTLNNTLSQIFLDGIEKYTYPKANITPTGPLSSLHENKGYEDLYSALSDKGWSQKKLIYEPVFESINYLCENTTPAVSVIIVATKATKDGLITLQELFKQRCENYELIFVNNGAQESAFADYTPYINTLIRLNKNTGAYLSRNIGALFAKAPILLFLDDDATPTLNIIHSFLTAFNEYDIIAVRGAVLPKTESPLNSLAKHYYLGDKPFPIYADIEGNTAYRADMFYKVGGWDDEIIFGGGGVDLSRRLCYTEPDMRKQIYSPDPIIYHDFAIDTKNLQTKKEKQTKSHTRLRKKHTDYDQFLQSWKRFRNREDLLIKKQHSKIQFPKPTISVCIPTYNRAAYLPEALKSILSQTNQDCEVVIVDDGSTDNTSKIVKPFLSKQVHYIQKDHTGAPDTRNWAIDKARGNYILWMDSDDLLMPDVIKSYFDAIQKWPDADVLYGDLKVFGDVEKAPKTDFRYEDYYKRNDYLLRCLVTRNRIPNGGSLLKKSLFDKIGFYNTLFKRAHDYEFWTRAIRTATFKHIGRHTLMWRWHNQNISTFNVKMDHSYESKILQKFLQDYRIEQLFPQFNWQSKNRPTSQFLAYLEIAKAFAHWCTKDNALDYYLKAFQNINPTVADSLKTEQNPWPLISDTLKQLFHDMPDAYADHRSQIDRMLQNSTAVTHVAHHTNETPLRRPSTLRILFICHDFPPYRYAGVQNYALDLAKAINKTGIAEVDILHPIFRERYEDYGIISSTFENLRVFKLTKETSNALESNGVWHEGVSRVFDLFLRKQKYDVIHVHSLGQLSAAPVEIAKKHNVPLIMTLHDAWFLCFYWFLITPQQNICSGPESVTKCTKCFMENNQFNNPPANLHESIYSAVEYRKDYLTKTLKKFNKVNAVCNYIKNKYLEYGFTDIETVSLGMNRVSPLPRKTSFTITFGFIGQILRHKGVHLLIDAFKQLTNQSVELKIYGKSFDTQYLNAILGMIQTDGRITYCGEYTPPQLPEILSGVDITVFPSLIESYPVVILESLMNKVPVIASRTGGIPEFIHNNANGLLFENGNVLDLKNNLEYIINNPEYIDQLRNNITPLKEIAEDARHYIKQYTTLIQDNNEASISPSTKKTKFLFYFFKNVHIPILIPIYKKLKALHPEAEIAFGYMQYAPQMRAGFTKDELSILQSYGEKMYAVPQKFRPDITFIADSVYQWTQGCGKLVHVGHGVLSKGQYYTDTAIARREELADLVCVSGSFHADIMHKIISKPVVATGMAKLDAVFAGRIAAATVKRQYGLPDSGYRYILYAPTFNDELSCNPHIGSRINEVLPDEKTLLIIKLHGSTRQEYKQMYRKLVEQDQRIIYADELDITPFLALADVMISDVSSAMMEFAALDKPVVLYNNPNRETYQNYNPNDIEFKWRDIGLQVNNLEGMKAAVQQSFSKPAEFSYIRKKYSDQLFANKYDGRAAERIIEQALSLVDQNTDIKGVA